MICKNYPFDSKMCIEIEGMDLLDKEQNRGHPLTNFKTYYRVVSTVCYWSENGHMDSVKRILSPN